MRYHALAAENGAVLFYPGTGKKRLLGDTPRKEFVEALQQHKLEPFSVGEVIVATWQPHEKVVLELIKEMGLELTLSFNKGAVMVLPSGINKATGLLAALREMGLRPDQVVGLGDAENDHVFLKNCGCSAAVRNAIPMLQEEVDVIMTRDHGAGVEELAQALVDNDLAAFHPHLKRQHPESVAVERRSHI